MGRSFMGISRYLLGTHSGMEGPALCWAGDVVFAEG